jgi:hypothetical protein
MPIVTERLKCLNAQLEALTNALEHSVNPRERKQVLQRMKFLIDDIDVIIRDSLFHDTHTMSDRATEAASSNPQNHSERLPSGKELKHLGRDETFLHLPYIHIRRGRSATMPNGGRLVPLSRH